jgi:hypothetical protein
MYLFNRICDEKITWSSSLVLKETLRLSVWVCMLSLDEKLMNENKAVERQFQKKGEK